MTNNQLTDEQIAQLLGDACMVIGDRFATVDELSAAKAIRALAVELQERRKADSEPVAEVVSIYGDPEDFGEREIRPLVGIQQMPYGTKLYRHAQPAPVVQPVMFIDGDISSEDADKLAKVIREFNEEDERPLAKMARIIRDNPHPTNECDMPKAQPAKGLESAGWQFKSVNGDWLGLIDEHGKNQTVREGCEVREVYAMADGVNERDQVRREHADWSQATFGNVGPVGPLKHLSKEALEAAEQPGDLSEWADMQFLLWDAQRRAGITDDQITQAMIEKLAVNKQREWPEPKDGEPRLHIKEQPAPVVQCVPLGDSPYDVPYSMPSNLRELIAEEIGILFSDDDAQSVWNVCRSAAMLAAAPQSHGSEPATVPDKWIPVSEQMPEVGDIVLTAMGGVVNVGETECSAANCRFFTSVISGRELPATHWMPLPAAPQEVK